MKPLTCEMCGSTNLLKQDGVFVCQSCGTKYSVEEAKKMMVEGTVSVEGTVKIDTSSELKNLYEIARRAKDMENSANAEKYYDMILVKDPTSWEASFYVVYYRAMGCTIAEIWSAAHSVVNCLPSVFSLVSTYVPEDEQITVLNELYSRVYALASMLNGAATHHFEGIDDQIKGDFVQEYINNVSETTTMLYVFGDLVTIEWPNNVAVNEIAVAAWEAGTEFHRDYVKYLQDREGNKQIILEYIGKIQKIKPDYQAREVDTSSAGCYIATAVYGSYDCPEVWTLRRFRDYTLAETWYGRAFISAYYAISPTLVKWFGKTEWFKRMWQAPLDKLVSRLQNNGVENTPYNDRQF